MKTGLFCVCFCFKCSLTSILFRANETRYKDWSVNIPTDSRQKADNFNTGNSKWK